MQGRSEEQNWLKDHPAALQGFFYSPDKTGDSGQPVGRDGRVPVMGEKYECFT